MEEDRDKSGDPDQSGAEPRADQASQQSGVSKPSNKPRLNLRFIALGTLITIGIMVSLALAQMYSPAYRAFWYQFRKSDYSEFNVQFASHTFTTKEKPTWRATALSGQKYRLRIYRKEFNLFKGHAAADEGGWQPVAFMMNPSPALPDDLAAGILRRTPALHDLQLTLKGISSYQGESVGSIESLPPGQYIYLAESAKNETIIGAFNVSDIGIFVRKSPDNILIKAFDLNTLNPVKATVDIFNVTDDGRQASQIQSTECDGNGVVFTSLVSGAQIAVKASNGKSEAISWSGAAMGQWFGDGGYAGLAESTAPEIFDVRVDRTAYRLGQTVFFKALLRRQSARDGLIAPAFNTPVRVQVCDPEGNELAKFNLRTGQFGDLKGSFRIPENGKTGDYNINLSLDNGRSGSGTAGVIQYRKPEYQVEILPDQKVTLSGQKAKLKVRASYYFGGPVAGAKVSFNSSSSPEWSLREQLRTGGPESGFFASEQQSDYYDNSANTSGTAFTDDNGVAEILIDTGENAENPGPYDLRFIEKRVHLNVTVTDLSRKTVDASGSALVTPGKFAVFLEPGQTLLEPGQVISAKVKAVDYDGKPVSCKASLKLERWSMENDKWKRTLVQEENVNISSGKAAMTLPASIPAGQYLLSLEGSDGQRTVRDSIFVYVPGDVVEDQAEPDQFKVVLDKKVYERGDTVKALITVPDLGKQGKTVGLATIEGMSIFAHKTIDFTKNSSIVEFPLKDCYVPEVTLAVRTVNKNRQSNETSRQIRIYPRPKLLKVDVTADKSDYRPGETMTLAVRATKADGSPAADTQFALAVVDESIYAVRPDVGQDINHVFWGSRPMLVSGACSFDAIAEFRPTQVELFQFTPYDQASMQQLECAEQRFAGAEMQCAPAACPTPAAAPGAVPAPRPRSATAVADGASARAVVVRSNFQDTAFWAPDVVTDPAGKATIKVKLPDNLTQWRATAMGLTRAAETGFSCAKFKVNKDIMARLSMPRFFTQDDQGVITGIVHNNSKKRQQIKLELASSGQFKVSAPLVQILTVEPEQAGRFNWPITTVGEGKADVTLKAFGTTDADALVEKIPVRSFSYPAFACKNGILKADDEKLTLPLLLAKDARPGTGKFSLSISPTAIGPVLGNFDKLIDYPYGCTEQTMSRLLPSVVAMQLHKKLGLPIEKEQRTKFQEVYKQGILKLIDHHGDDGGWGWWKNDQSSPYLTAYVLEGLYLLKEAGFSVDQAMIDGGLAWLKEHSETSFAAWDFERSTDDAYCLYVRTLYNDMPSPDAIRKHLAQCPKMSPEGRAYLTLAFHAAKDQAAARAAYDKLLEVANRSWEFTDWNHTEAMIKKLNRQGADYTYRFEGVETTALAMRAALAMEPKNEKLLSSIRRWILLQKDEQGWSNTKATAAVFLALLQDEISAAEGKSTNYTVSASAGNKTLGSFLFNKANQYSPEKVIDTALDGSEKEFSLVKNGKGRLYYSSLLTYERPIKPGQVVAGMSSPPDLAIERKFFRLQRFKDDSGVYTYQAVPIPESGVKAGETILMKVLIKSPLPVPYVMVSAALPAGAEVVSNQDSNELHSPEMPVLSDASGNVTPEAAVADDSAMQYWWTHQDILDDRMVFFVTNMPEGKNELKALLRMEMPGKFNVNPVRFEAMYTKKIRGYSGSDRITVNE